MKVWLACLVTSASAQSLRGPEVRVVHEVHRRQHIELLSKRRHTELHRTARGVDLSSLKEGDVNSAEGQDQILAGAGSFSDEVSGPAAAPSAAPQTTLLHHHQKVEAAAPAVQPTDAASFVFGGTDAPEPEHEALTREEVKMTHYTAKAPQMPAAAQKAQPPYQVTLDLPGPPPIAVPSTPLAAVHAAASIQKTNSLVEQQDMAKQQQLIAQQQAVAQQQAFIRQQASQQASQQAAAAQQQAQQAAIAAQAAQSQGAAVATATTPTGITRPKGWDQCLKFSRFIKSQGVTGMELIKTWKSSCAPAVQSGVATERYKVMCNALGGAVEPFASQQDYDVTKMCDAVLAVFHDVTAVDVRAATF